MESVVAKITRTQLRMLAWCVGARITACFMLDLNAVYSRRFGGSGRACSMGRAVLGRAKGLKIAQTI